LQKLPTQCNLIITGVGGPGNILAAKVLAAAILAQGLEVTVGDVYGLSQRGGAVASHVRWQPDDPLPPLVPRDGLNVLVAFEPMEGLRILDQFGGSDTLAVVNATPVAPIGVQAGRFAYPDFGDLFKALEDRTRLLKIVKATDAALELGSIQVLNIVMMGALYGTGFIGGGAAFFEAALRGAVRKEFIDLNLKAFAAGRRLAATPET
jgi:indolepyruvate ferredoxin oxidoreductase beta subunit